MKTFDTSPFAATGRAWARLAWGVFALTLGGSLHAASTDISDVPVNSTSTSRAKPNIMLLLKSSTSMGFTHAPDQLEGSTIVPPAAQPIGYRANQCNPLYFSPDKDYPIPRDAGGAFLPTPVFTAAPYDYYTGTLDVDGNANVNLTTGFRAFDRFTRARRSADASDIAQQAYYYTFQRTDGTIPATLDWKTAPCTTAYDPASANTTGSLPVTGGTWIRTLVTGAAMQQKFATWYTYHRTRMALTKSGIGMAFNSLNDNFRVGLINANPLTRADIEAQPSAGAAVHSDYYLPLAPFDATQRSSWYSKLNSQPIGGSSPMREALARVGRHFGNKHDGINVGMDGDPARPSPASDPTSCQQNFTIMTTDGHWNKHAETAGPVDLDGNLVGQRDGTLTDVSGDTHFPIWDGGTTGLRTTTDKLNNYSAAACPTGMVTKTTAQRLKSTSQVTQSTSQRQVSTLQRSMSTTQLSRTTSQRRQSTSQVQQTVRQVKQRQERYDVSTFQSTMTTTQYLSSTVTPTQWTTQLNISTQHIEKSTDQWKASTSQTTRSTLQNLVSTSASTKSTEQWNKSTSQTSTGTIQRSVSTAQISKSTTQSLKSTRQSTQTTSRMWATTGEVTTPVASCIDTPLVTCTPETNTVSVTAGTCVSQAPNAGNEFVTVSCVNSVTGPVGVAAGSCVAQPGDAAHGYLEITCASNNTGPTFVASCTPGTAGDFTVTTCSTATTGPTLVASCTPIAGNAGNNYLTTSCSSATTGPTPVGSCTAVAPVGPSFIETTCTTALTGPTPVASCTDIAATSPNFIATTCALVTTGPTQVASCTPAAAAAGNSYTTTTCNTTSTGPTPAASCTPDLAGPGNGWVTTTCSTNTTGPVAVDSTTCVGAAANVGNSFTSTTCNTTNNGPTPVAACTPTAASAGNSWVATTCQQLTTGPTGVAACTNAAGNIGNSYVTTTCAVTATGPTPTGSCTAAGANAGNGWTSTTCNTVTTAAVNVGACTPVAASAGNNWTATVCGTFTSAPVGVPSCTPSATVTCPAPVVTTTPVNPATCVPAAASAGNNWTTTTCNANANPTGPTAVANCTGGNASAAPNAGNNWTTKTCTTTVVMDWTWVAPDASASGCTAVNASAGNGWVRTLCDTTANSGPTGVQDLVACGAQTGNAGNNWRTVTCTTATSGPTPVASCTDQLAAAGNGWQSITCDTQTTAPVFLGACLPPNWVAWAAATGQTHLNVYNDFLAPGKTYANQLTPRAGTAVYPAANWWSQNNYTATSCSTAATGPTFVASCTDSAASAGNSYVKTTCAGSATPWAPTAACTDDAPTAANNYVKTSCQTVTTGPTGVASCTGQTADAGNGYMQIDCATVDTGPTPVASCTDEAKSAANQQTLTTCADNNTAPVEVASASCVAQGANGTNSFTSTTCAPIPGQKIQFSTTTTVTTQGFSGGVLVGTPVVASTSTTSAADLDGVCYKAADQPVPFPSPAYSARPAATTTASASASPVPPSGCTAWPCSVDSGSTTGGSTDSLADVAQYYYVTDLRPELANNAPRGPSSGFPAEDDRRQHQRMVTYVVGLGVSGTLNYSQTYLSDATGSFADLRTNAISWPVWPTSASLTEAQTSDPKSIDDFWHTAVNGRGRFFSARDPASLLDGISGALGEIFSSVGSGAGAATATSTPAATGNAIFTTSYNTSKWIGDIQAKTYGNDIVTNGVSSASSWSAQVKLDAMTQAACDDRDIKLIHPGATNNLVNFTWNTVGCSTASSTTGLDASEKAYFDASEVTSLSQFATGTSTASQRSLAEGANLVNFLRGQRGLEGYVPGDDTKLYRTREHVLGDIVNSQMAYVREPDKFYTDPGYDTFKTTNASRAPMLYVGANDGMLHAFNAPDNAAAANGGKEAWAVIPTAVLPNLHKLADVGWGSHHEYFVDGSPTVGDIYSSGTWKSILVGGLNKGGKAFFALDVTNPTSPKALWEFKASSGTCATTAAAAVGATSDCYLGYSFGRPVLTKMSDGTWVVLITSGYNNNTGDGNGQGYLYVLNAATGAIVKRIGTGVGSVATPSGLGELTTYATNPQQNNMATRVYGGDMLGNIWRFDINAGTAQLVTTLKAPDSTAQPITTRIKLAEVDGNTFILVGTGRLLGTSDVTDTQVQSVYSILDPLTSDPGNPVVSPASLRTSLRHMELADATGTSVAAKNLARTISCVGDATNCAGANGWYFDLSKAGERVNIDMGLAMSTLVIQSNVPDTSECGTGYNMMTAVDFSTGAAIPGYPYATVWGDDALATGANLQTFPGGGGGGSCTVVQLVTNADGTLTGICVPLGTPSPLGKRISWREIGQ